MKKETKRDLIAAIAVMAAFCVWTLAVCIVDLQAVGPQGSRVGFAALNLFIHSLTGVNMSLYVITDWLGLVPTAFAAGFGILGLVQWIRRRSIQRVDRSILILGSFYVVVVTAYLLFEACALNYRPVLINGNLEVSYPSSTTLLVMCVMPTSVMQLKKRIKNATVKRTVAILIAAFSVFVVIGRFLSGVHWFTDIIGGLMLSVALVLTYRVAVSL